MRSRKLDPWSNDRLIDITQTAREGSATIIRIVPGHDLSERGGHKPGVRGIDGEPGREQTILQEAADVVEQERCACVVANARQDPQLRIGRCVQAMVSRYRCQGAGGTGSV